jgi:hypothetical protein
MTKPMIIDGKRFELTLREQMDGEWHWLMTAPGQIVLSGGAANETQALQSAWSVGEALVRLSPL